MHRRIDWISATLVSLALIALISGLAGYQKILFLSETYKSLTATMFSTLLGVQVAVFALLKIPRTNFRKAASRDALKRKVDVRFTKQLFLFALYLFALFALALSELLPLETAFYASAIFLGVSLAAIVMTFELPRAIISARSDEIYISDNFPDR